MKRITIALLLALPTGAAIAQQYQSNGSRPVRQRSRQVPTGNDARRQPFDSPTQRQSPFVRTTPSGPPLPEEFQILMVRSMFARGRGQFPGAPSGPETQFALRGIAVQDGVSVAFLENTATHAVSRVTVGQSIASGQIAGIMPNSLSFQSADRPRRVTVGQTLAGFPAPAPTLSAEALARAGGKQTPGRLVTSQGGRGGGTTGQDLARTTVASSSAAKSPTGQPSDQPAADARRQPALAEADAGEIFQPTDFDPGPIPDFGPGGPGGFGGGPGGPDGGPGGPPSPAGPGPGGPPDQLRSE